MAILRDLVRSIGFCCIYDYLQKDKNGSRAKAKRLGVDRQVIQYWKRKVKTGTCRCASEANCSFLVNKRQRGS